MSQQLNRREVLGAAGAALLGSARALAAPADVEVRISQVSPHTFRINIGGDPPDDGALVQPAWGAPLATLRGAFAPRTVKAAGVVIKATSSPLAFAIETAKGEPIQHLKLDPDTGVVSFAAGTVPLLALGEGGPQFDRRGANIPSRSGQGGFQLRTYGGRVPIQWLIGTNGWALFVHVPYGSFDLTGAEGKFVPPSKEGALPLDLFFVTSKEPVVLMGEYARITGHPELPPLWSFGYQQSHRTLASREEILGEAKTFREKKLPCDALIYLGTGFCPSGWNTDNTEFTWNSKVFPDPKAMLDQLHQDHFKVVLHIAYPTGLEKVEPARLRAMSREAVDSLRIHEMSRDVKAPCDPQRRAETQPSCYWEMHRPLMAAGADGWWPDEGDALNTPSRLNRIRMYWEAQQLDRPNQRVYALHRNGYSGMQRYGAFLWSGDVSSLWETLKNHVPIAANVGLSGIPYWGTDIGGFVPTKELTGELYVRWFQFAAFNTLFRSHGRTWKLRLPWGWNTGETGPVETPNVPLDPKELHNAAVEPVCRQYLELRYRMMPYLYSAVREATVTGMPVIRAMWLHYPDDPIAVARGDQYLWGRDILVAPVVQQGATERNLYLPRGAWHDFWTNERVEGGREITRPVTLATTPLYVRAGAIIPMDPVKQYTSEKVEGPLTVSIYPGANGSFLLYEDDGASFNYRKGDWMGLEMVWNDARKSLSIHLAPGSKFLEDRDLAIKLGTDVKRAVFRGRPLEIRF